MTENKGPGAREASGGRHLREILKKKAVLLSLCAGLICTGCGNAPGKYELRDRAVDLFNSGDYEGAIDVFNEALSASDGEVGRLQFDILKYRAECELRTGDYEAAKSTYGILGQVLDKDEDKADIERINAEISALDAIEEANSYFSEGRFDEAYDLFSGYAALDGSEAGRIAYFNKGVCAERKGDFQDAYALFTAYLEVFPDDEAAMKEAEFCGTRYG